MRGHVWYPVFLTVMLTVQSAMGQYAAPQLEQAIEASCKVSVPVGNGQFASGSGCIYGYVPGKGLVITAAHVVRGAVRGASITVQIGRRLVKLPCRVIWLRADVDTATLEFDVSDWPADAGPLPRGVPLAPSDWQVPLGHAVFSVGHPGGVKVATLLTARVVEYSQKGALGFHPGPELGRSGSAVFAIDADGRVFIVGVISVRDTDSMRSNTKGYAITPRQFRSRRSGVVAGVGTMYPTQCPGGVCPLPGSGGFLMPDREQRIQRIEQKQAQERSPGTIPLPPMAPPVDLGPLDARIAAVEKSLTETINRSNEHSEAIGKLNATAEKAVALAEMVAKRDEAFGKDLAAIRAEAAKADQAIAMAADAQGRAENVAGAVADVEDNVAEQLDADNPRSLLGRVRDRIEARVEERIGGLKDTLSGMIGLPTFLGGTGLGMGGIALIVAVLALLRRGAIKASQGEETLTQQLAARTSNPYDDMAADFFAEKVLAKIGDRLPSQRGRTTKTAKASK